MRFGQQEFGHSQSNGGNASQCRDLKAGEGEGEGEGTVAGELWHNPRRRRKTIRAFGGSHDQ